VRLLWLAGSEHDLPADPSWLTPTERERAGGMRFTKRRNDYLLGRWVGKNAVARALGRSVAPADLAAIAITNAEDGAPEVRVAGEAVPLCISLTDRAGWGVCVLGHGDVAVGCDLELVEPRSRGFVRDYFTPAEREWVAAAQGGDEWDVRANLVWSAKESALKVLRCGLRRDTRDVEVTTGDGAAERWEPLALRVPEGRVFAGWWQRFGDFLLTFAAAGEVAPPVDLVEPPALRSALPSHDWLAEPHSPVANAPERPETDGPGAGNQRGET
jgi:4'-phosphopantetheinyl transferase